VLALAACSGSGPSSPTSSSAAPSSSSAAPTGSSASPSSSSPAPSASSSASHSEQTAPLTVYYIAIEDNGGAGPKIGCNDSAVPTQTAAVAFTDKVEASMKALLATPSRDIGQSGLINVLYQSHLAYVDSRVEGATVTVDLSGTFQLGGTCDIPRAKAQLEYTAMAATGAQQAAVYVDGRTLDDVLSLK
jgi:spore germination protein GerM